jgi:hypothetical protein
MQTYVAVLALTPFLLLALVLAYSQTIRAILAELARQNRLACIRANGKKRARVVFDEFKKVALKKGYSPQDIEWVINKHKEFIIEDQGTKAANKILGEPSHYERYF